MRSDSTSLHSFLCPRIDIALISQGAQRQALLCWGVHTPLTPQHSLPLARAAPDARRGRQHERVREQVERTSRPEGASHVGVRRDDKGARRVGRLGVDQPFNHHTGIGSVKEVRGAYYDALCVKRATVVPMIVETCT